MRISALDKWVLSAIVVAIIINVASTAIGNVTPETPKLAAIVLAFALFIYVLARVAMIAANYYLHSRFSVLIFMLDAQQRLLLYRHPQFQRYIPPGGRLALSEAPDDAVSSRLRDKAGVGSFIFDPHFHAPRFPITELVEEVIRPFAVHREHRRQRGGVRSHYCFVYVCRLAGGATANLDCRWVDLADLIAMDVHTRPFDDIIAKYRLILEELRSGSATS